MRKVFVGVDVAMKKLDISISVDGQKYDTLQILNNESSILGFFDYLKNTYKKSDFYFGYEATVRRSGKLGSRKCNLRVAF